jgi:sugar phosphate isomerase/epimerase
MNILNTLHGNFPIGVRLMGWPWHQQPEPLAAWLKENGFTVCDVPATGLDAARTMREAGLEIGTADLHEWTHYGWMLSKDPAKRKEAAAIAADRIRAFAAIGVNKFFTLMIAEDPSASPHDTFRWMIDSYAQIGPALEQTGSRLSIEGWPEMGAHCCNPGSYRAFFAELSSPAYGVNYDPSHLIRLGIDHVRFLREFASRVVHTHGKDTEIFTEKLYDIGYEQRMASLDGGVWRYTIPGHGQARWPMIFRLLQESGYRGAVCIEHEDAAFCDTEAQQKQGLLFAGRFLESC